MSAAVLYGLVILSALAHPAWNAIFKSANDRVMAMVAIRCVGLVLGLAVLNDIDRRRRASPNRRRCLRRFFMAW